MNHFQSVNSEMLGFLFIAGMIAIGVLISIVFVSTKRKQNSLGDDLPEILEKCASTNVMSTGQEKPECEVLYEMEHYNLRFLKIEELWYPCLVVGDHQSSISDINPNTKFRNLFLETLLYLKVKQTNQRADTLAL